MNTENWFNRCILEYAGIDINECLIAASKENIDTVKVLLDVKADVNIKSGSPSRLASQNGYLELSKLLITNKADVNNHNIMWNACRNGHVDIVKLLIENNGNITNRHMFVAGVYGHIDVVKLLIENNIDITGNSLICISSEKGYLEMVKLLIENKADIAEDKNYSLRWASKNGHVEIVKLLLENRADINVDNNYSLRWARKNGHDEIVKLLQQGYFKSFKVFKLKKYNFKNYIFNCMLFIVYL